MAGCWRRRSPAICAASPPCSGPRRRPKAGSNTRRLVNALFLRRFDKEYLEEMKGIADGATAAGARFDGRPIDLVDIVALNCWPEIETLDSALEATPTGLEGMRFPHQQPRAKPAPRPMHCSAFAATGPATADGKIVFGHITMFCALSGQLLQRLARRQAGQGASRPDAAAIPAASRAAWIITSTTPACSSPRRPSARRASTSTARPKPRAFARPSSTPTPSIEAVEILKKDNNGLYTNEWLLGDINTNEIAMFELGTHKSKLYRSSKNEWFGGTEGFYWGCNNTKDLEVRLETIASVEGRPANVVFRPSDRDIAWLKLYQQAQGQDRRRLRQAGLHDAAAGRVSIRSTPSSRPPTWPSS